MLTITLDKSFWKTNANNDNKRKKVGLGKEHATISFLYNSVRQTNSALPNFSLNIQGHVEVPKVNFFGKKSCPSAVISLYMSRFSQIREF